MPRKYASRSRRRAYRRKPWYRRKYDALSLAAKAAKGVWYLKGLVNSEMLHKDTTLSNAISNTGDVFALANMAQGDTDSGRTGNSILCRSLAVRLSFEVNSAVTGDTRIRYLIIQDTQQVGDTSPTWSDVMSNTTPESLLATNTFGRFKVLCSKAFTLTPATGGNNTRWVTKYLKMRMHARYNGTTANDIQKNGLYFLVISSEATNTPTVRGTLRLGYHDN